MSDSGCVVLCPNPYSDKRLKLTFEAKKLLDNAGFKTVISPVFRGAEMGERPLSESAPGASLLVTFGGDGTILHAARRVMEMPLPILGVNLGKKGFMTGLAPDKLERIIDAANGKYTIDSRMMLDVSLVREGREILTDSALNDAAVTGIARMIHLRALGEGSTIMEFSGDGIVVATPTGSTAYSMSAGGPIVEPSARNIILTPICAHDLAARSFVLAPERVITIMLGDLSGRHAVLSVDGGEAVDLCGGDLIHMRRSEHETLLAHMGERSFYEDLRRQLGQLMPP